jgi:hypothetical protein
MNPTFPPDNQGYLIFLQRLEQEASSLKGVSIQRSHVLFDIGDLAKIKESEHKGIEHGEYMGSCPLANLARIFGKSAISTGMQAIFNGIITNDKFCLSQIRHLPKISARKGFPLEIQYPAEATE